MGLPTLWIKCRNGKGGVGAADAIHLLFWSIMFDNHLCSVLEDTTALSATTISFVMTEIGEVGKRSGLVEAGYRRVVLYPYGG